MSLKNIKKNKINTKKNNLLTGGNDNEDYKNIKEQLYKFIYENFFNENNNDIKSQNAKMITIITKKVTVTNFPVIYINTVSDKIHKEDIINLKEKYNENETVNENENVDAFISYLIDKLKTK